MKKSGIIRICAFAFVLFLLLIIVGCSTKYTRLTHELSIGLVASPATFTHAGEPITFTYWVNDDDKVSNGVGSGWSENGSLDDEFLPITFDLTQSTCNANPCSSTYIVTEEDVARGSISATVSVSKTIKTYYYEPECCGTSKYEFTTYQGSATLEIPLEQAALLLSKTGNPATFKLAGEQITYAYVLENAGDLALAGPFTIEDDQASVTCPETTSLAPGESLTCTATYQITEDDVVAGSVMNTAVAHAFIDEPEKRAIESDLVSFEIVSDAQPAFSFEKWADRDCYTKVDEVIKYYYVLTNTGNVPLSAPFLIEDDRVPDYSRGCPADVDTLAVGEKLTCWGFYQVTSDDMRWTIWNTAQATAHFLGKPLTSAEALESVCYEPPPPQPVPQPAQQSAQQPAPNCSEATGPDCPSGCEWYAEGETCR
ncbi:MAG: hypothetical protein ABIF04_03800 [Chloroflexota bacterium]